MPPPPVTPAHRTLMARTSRIFGCQQRRARQHGQQLDYDIEELRTLIYKALRWPSPGVGLPCPLCNERLTIDNFQVDHVEPIASGGRFHYANLQVVCAPCNKRKKDSSFSTALWRIKHKKLHEKPSLAEQWPLSVPVPAPPATPSEQPPLPSNSCDLA